jgi:hypothetical protein
MRQKFLVGDMVRVLKAHDENKALVGKVGTVAVYKLCNDTADRQHALYGVKFEDKAPRCHDLYQDGKSHCRQGHGWWIPAAKLELCG